MFKVLFLIVFLGFVEAQYYYTNYCKEPTLENGRVRVRQRSQLARFSCNYRYTLIGNKYATCRNGRWDVPTPVCVRSGCESIRISSSKMIAVASHNKAWMVFFCYPKYELVGSPAIYCNGYRWNATVPECVDSTKQVPTSCDFEAEDMCGWKNDELHDFDWERINNSTYRSIIQTGPKMDHTFGNNGTGYYMYIESEGFGKNDTARLLSPVYDASLSRDGCFSFFYHMFGRTVDIGTLKVYQKPVSMTLNQLQSDLRIGRNKPYLLFDKSGYQGKDWYGSVTPIVHIVEDFQIIIEGIRGLSLASNLAIDDVAILNGDKCTQAMSAAPTPGNEALDSCAGRCETDIKPGYECSCTIMCLFDDNCCIDYLDTCEFVSANKTLPDNETNETAEVSTTTLPPQTEKLVATSTTMSTLPITTTSTTTIPTTTMRLTTKVLKPTTKKLIPVPTIPSRTKPTTTPKPTPTTVTPKHTTGEPATASVTSKPTTTTKSTLSPTTTTKFVKISTTVSPKPSTTDDSEISIGFKQELNSKTTVKTGTSGVKIGLILLLVIGICCGALWVGITLRGHSFIYKLRGRTQQDSEVRFLNSDVDDEE